MAGNRSNRGNRSNLSPPPMPLKGAAQHMSDRLVVKELTTKISFTQTFALKNI